MGSPVVLLFGDDREMPTTTAMRRITAQYNEDNNVSQGVMFGQLDEAGDRDSFVATYLSCYSDEVPYVTFDVRSFDDEDVHDVDLFVQEQSGAWHNATGNASNPTVTDEPPSGDYDYEVHVENDGEGRIAYGIRYVTDCDEYDRNGGGDDWDDDNDREFFHSQ